jgi:putative ABC transport system permease protein
MKARDLAELALRNLREALLRNALTTLGVAVGVASLVAMLSLGVGLQNLASQRLTRSGLFDAVFVTARSFGDRGGLSREGSSRENSDSRQNPEPQELKLLDEDTRQAFARLPNVTEVYPQIRFVADARYGETKRQTMVLALPDSSRRSGAFDAMKGTFFSSSAAQEAILQMDFAKELNPQPESLIGKELTLRYMERSTSASDAELMNALTGSDNSGAISVLPRIKKFRIIGITDSDPSAGLGGFGGARVFLPLQVAEGLHVAQPGDFRTMLASESGKPSYMALTVRTKSPNDVPKVEDAIKKMGYSAFSLMDAARSLRLVFAVFDLFLGLFGSLALTVASLGIINTLVMAILERRREIGILKALGASDKDVKSLFFAEAAAMGFFGGILGVTFGWLIGQALTLGASLYLRSRDLPGVSVSHVPWWLGLSAVAFAVVVSLAAGLYPAARAAKLNPVEALRYE